MSAKIQKRVFVAASALLFFPDCCACLAVIRFHGRPRQARVMVQRLLSRTDISLMFALKQLVFCCLLAFQLPCLVAFICDARFSYDDDAA
jgi:hypothetical protein